jgi:hypothetical protein
MAGVLQLQLPQSKPDQTRIRVLLKLAQALQRRQQRFILFGVAKAHHLLVKAVAIKGGERNGCNAQVLDQLLAELRFAGIGHGRDIHALEIGA